MQSLTTDFSFERSRIISTGHSIDVLDDSLLLEIFKNLDFLDIKSIQFVCRRWNRLVTYLLSDDQELGISIAKISGCLGYTGAFWALLGNRRKIELDPRLKTLLALLPRIPSINSWVDVIQKSYHRHDLETKLIGTFIELSESDKNEVFGYAKVLFAKITSGWLRFGKISSRDKTCHLIVMMKSCKNS